MSEIKWCSHNKLEKYCIDCVRDKLAERDDAIACADPEHCPVCITSGRADRWKEERVR